LAPGEDRHVLSFQYTLETGSVPTWKSVASCEIFKLGDAIGYFGVWEHIRNTACNPLQCLHATSLV
jgi:hypothetical protein